MNVDENICILRQEPGSFSSGPIVLTCEPAGFSVPEKKYSNSFSSGSRKKNNQSKSNFNSSQMVIEKTEIPLDQEVIEEAGMLEYSRFQVFARESYIL